MEILHGFITFLAVKVCVSTNEVQGVLSSSVTLECPLTSSNHKYHWQFYTGGSWSVTITSNSKYNNADTKHLFINDLAVSDSGTYRCTVSPTGQGFVTLTVTDPGTWSQWGEWNKCLVTCGGGNQSRIRHCLTNSCEGSDSGTRDCNTSPCPDYEKSSTSSTPVGGVIAGAISAFVLLLGVAGTAFFIVHKRRQKGLKKHNDYAVTDMRQGEEHSYIQTRVKDDYCNTDLRSPVEQTKSNGDVSVEYNASELSKLLLNKHVCEKTMHDEFQTLSKIRPQENVTDYKEITEHDLNETGMSYDTYVNKAVVKQKHITDKISVITEMPTKHTMGMFWTLINKLKIHDIILLVQGKEKISHFFPTTDEPMETNNLEVRMISAGRQHDGIFHYSLELFDQDSQNVSETSLFKMTNWKIEETFPDISTLCKLITTQNATSESVLMIGSKGSGYRICGVLSVCLGVVYAIRDDQKFSILQIAMDLVKTRPDLFQTFEEYELCYNVLRHYLENEHCYAVIN